ncbi:zf-TFIIB domain-containing protein [Terrilactibacillus sp. S3-3]|nr:zf-TFIIB domain-containing protein [Terrilactibacillus sp. S3-3]
MNCPVCENERLKEIDRDGVLIDICPNCKGIWLDRGELDKIIGEVRKVRKPFNQWYGEHDDDDGSDGDNRYDKGRRHDDGGRTPYGQTRKKKKKSILDMFEDMFD